MSDVSLFFKFSTAWKSTAVKFSQRLHYLQCSGIQFIYSYRRLILVRWNYVKTLQRMFKSVPFQFYQKVLAYQAVWRRTLICKNTTLKVIRCQLKTAVKSYFAQRNSITSSSFYFTVVSIISFFMVRYIERKCGSRW